MTIEQAFALLDQLISNFRGTREEHKAVAEAIAVLKQATTPSE